MSAAKKDTTILLATLCARYIHSAFGLRWIWANMGSLQAQTGIREFFGTQSPEDMAASLLEDAPALIGLSVHIWNIERLTEVAHIIKGVRPETILVVGGPEIAYEYEDTALFETADYLIRGEGEAAFPELCQRILAGDKPDTKLIEAPPLDLYTLQLPYDAYKKEDIANRIIYVEASRGCPFRCEFCLSSLDKKVRVFPLEPFLEAMDRLIQRGARHFKFVDRTFNLDETRMKAILDFFRERWCAGMQLHFEIVPDRLSEAALSEIKSFPDEGLHLEVGVQTYSVEAQEAISRRQDLALTERNLHYLREETGALIHADLIAGLPGEDWDAFGEGFNRLLKAGPQEIQVGILKRLKGAPIHRHTEAHKMVYSPTPPYEVLQTEVLDYFQLQRIKRFARYFDLYYNTGNFPKSLALLWDIAPDHFAAFMALSDHLWAKTERTHRIALKTLAETLYQFLVQRGVAPDTAAKAVKDDFYCDPGRKEILNLGM